VFDRIEIIKDKKETKSPKNRPPYIYQVPLTFIPGLGSKTIDKLLEHFNTEMNILHKLSKDDIEAVTNEKIARNIIMAREGQLSIKAGGGGVYGKVSTND
jgi:PHP family Zn ribbon phosphoesterase